MRLNVRFSGAGGQGVILSSVLLAKAYGIGENFNITQTQSYGPEARGGACKAEVVISDETIDYMKVDEADVFIAYNQAGYDKYCGALGADALVLVNSTLVKTDNEPAYQIPATQMAEEMGNSNAVNMVMLGALTKLLPKLHYDIVKGEITENFSKAIGEINVIAFNKGYEYMEEEIKQEKQKQFC